TGAARRGAGAEVGTEGLLRRDAIRGGPNRGCCHRLARVRVHPSLHGWERATVPVPVPPRALPGRRTGGRPDPASVRRDEEARGGVPANTAGLLDAGAGTLGGPLA